MIPQTVSFSGLSVPTDALLFPFNNRKAAFPCPADWVRLEFSASGHVDKLLQKCDKWLSKHINSRWASYEMNFSKTVVIMFEDDNDAILFKLMGGDTACLEEEPQD